MSLIDRYLARTVIKGTFLAIVILTVISGFLTFVSQLHNVGIQNYTIGTALLYTGSTLPEWISDIFPAGTLIGSLMALGTLAHANELLVFRSTGASLVRLARSLALAALVLVVVFVILAEFIAPPTKRYAESERALALYHQTALLGPFGLWARDGPLVVNVARMGSHHQFEGIHIFRLEHHHQLTAVGYARKALYRNHQWILEGLNETEFVGRHLVVRHIPRSTWPKLLSPDLFKVLIVNPGNLSGVGLWRYIRYLHHNHLTAERYEISFWKKIADFLSLPIMVCFSLPFLFGSTRTRGSSYRLFIGVGVGLLYYFLDNVMVSMGDAFRWPPLLVAFGPLALFSGLTAILIHQTT
jgi:lipopolysaccharide export system permease protein